MSNGGLSSLRIAHCALTIDCPRLALSRVVRRIPVAREAWLLIAPLLLVACAALLIQWYAAALVFMTLAALVAQLFRNPHRVSSAGEGEVLAPAEGTVVHAGALTGTAPYDGLTQQISIVSSLFDVHVLRAPIGGRIAQSVSASEPSYVVIESAPLAAAVAHHPGILSRTVLDARDGAQVARGEQIGMTRFGSQIDLFLPPSAKLSVQVQDRVKVGLTVVARVE